MLVIFFSIFVITAMLTWIFITIPLPALVRDTQLDGLQKIHQDPQIPRIGGLVLLCGMLIGILVFQPLDRPLILLLVLAFVTGFSEDVFKDINPIYRLILSFIVAGIACWLLDMSFYRSGADWVDQHILTNSWLAYGLAIFMIAGVMHATNIIDGYNGLMPGWTLLASIALLVIALRVGDTGLVIVLLLLLASVSGIIVFNYPQGKIFMGDGGAYLIGFILAGCSLMLINNNQMVSPWFPLVVVAYPVWETLFAIYRRIVLLKQSPGQPDRFQLQNLIHRLLDHLSPKSPHLNHCLVAPILCLFSLLSILPAFYYWNQTIPLVLIGILFIILYSAVYTILIRVDRTIHLSS